MHTHRAKAGPGTLYVSYLHARQGLVYHETIKLKDIETKQVKKKIHQCGRVMMSS